MADGNSLVPDSEVPRSARKRYSRRSPYWEHFEQKAECRYCKAMLCADPSMKKHYEETCPERHPKPGRQQQVSPAAPIQNAMHREQASTSKSGSDHLDQQKSAGEDQLVRMIALHGYPSSLVEDVQFGRFVGFLCPDFKMPSRDDVEDRCDALFDDEMRKLKEALRCTPGQVILSRGEAETTWGRVVYLAAHFIDGEWNLHRRVIQVFKESNDSNLFYEQIFEIKDYDTDYEQTHEENYVRLKETISCWGLGLKVCSVLCEETRDESELRNKLHDDNYLEHLSATQHKLLCGTDMCSLLNFIARQLKRCFDIASADYFYKGKSYCTSRDLSLSKKKRRGISSRLRLNHPWSWRYDSEWYACYYALEILHDECSSTAAEIAGLAGEATFQETELTESCRTTLGTTYRAIESLSASSSPTSNLCLIELLKLRKKLMEEYDGDGRLHDLGDFLDESYLSLSIPLVLDPRFKLTYVERIFKKAKLYPGFISEVRVAVHRLFTEYSNQGNEMDVDPSQQGHAINREGQEQEQEQEHPSSQGSRTELDAYLQDETVPINQENFDILEWWKDNCGRYPTVARMARDFLAIPTSTRPSSQQITEIANHLRRYA